MDVREATSQHSNPQANFRATPQTNAQPAGRAPAAVQQAPADGLTSRGSDASRRPTGTGRAAAGTQAGLRRPSATASVRPSAAAARQGAASLSSTSTAGPRATSCAVPQTAPSAPGVPQAQVADIAASAAAAAVPAAIGAAANPTALVPTRVPGTLAMFGNLVAALGCTFVFSAPMAFVFAMMAAAYTWYIAAQSGMRMLIAAPALLQLTCQNMRAELDRAIGSLNVMVQALIVAMHTATNNLRETSDQTLQTANQHVMPMLIETTAAARSIGTNIRSILVTAAKCIVGGFAAMVGVFYTAPFVTAGVASALSAEALAGVFGGPIGIGCAVGAILLTLAVAYYLYRRRAAQAAAAQAAAAQAAQVQATEAEAQAQADVRAA